MVRVFGCVFGQHDLRLVVLAGLLCLFACVTAMGMLARARIAAGRARLAWLAAAGTVAGSGIWATHFVAMLAYVSGFPVSYDPALTTLSIAIAVAVCGTGFAISLRPGFSAFGGAVTGAAIGAMHYVGMAAVRLPADAIWDPTYVVWSIGIGVGLMSYGMHFTLTVDRWSRYLTSGLIFTVAICSLHFTAMTAVVYRFDPRVVVSGGVLAPGSLAIAIAAIAALVVALGLVGALLDHHLADRASLEAQRLRVHVKELELTRDALQRTTGDLETALAAADAASKSKTRFLAAMSHELRTPLNAVIGFSEILETEALGPMENPRYKQYARDIRASGAHLLALINDILDLTRLDAGQTRLDLSLVDISALIRESLRMVALQAQQAKVALSADLVESFPAISCDPRRVRQILLNLLSNALKFTPEGGRVNVSVGRCASGVVVTVDD
ncbi:MAG: hypothetical protein JOZ55_08105, partial [Alphaproteobacteria bacterium]|nr:hypothetical protein [Alphaproteobacteria bacterium]